MGIIADIHRDLDRGALQLMAEYRGRLFGEAVDLCGDKALAEDLVFRTLERALDRVETYKEDNNLFAWMKSIMENIHKDDMKRPVARGTTAMEQDELERHAGSDNSTDEQILRNSDEEAVRRALRHIDPEFRQLVLMRYYEELSLKEIAGFLNKPVCTVSRRIQIALHLLAGKLEAEFGKKPVAMLLAALLGVGALFGAWVSPLGDWVAEKVFGSAPAEEERVQLNGIQTFAEPVCTEQMVGNVATASVVPQSAATKISNAQNTTKQESEQNMNIGSMIKSTVAATTVAAMGFAAQGEVKVVRVVPNGEAGENPDGASWATAYGDIKTAYESLGADGGEVWIKKGLYIMSNAVEMAANVSVYGGFAGTETSRDAADPKNNMTLLTGDQELNDRLMTGCPREWRWQTRVPAWDYETLTFAAPEPSYTYDAGNNYYFYTPWPEDIYNYSTPGMTADGDKNQKLFDALHDTSCAFCHSADGVQFGEVTYEGLVFSGFKTNVFNVVGALDETGADGSHLTIRNCRFLGCCNGLAKNTLGADYGPVRLVNVHATVDGCEFNRCLNGVSWSASGLLTDDLGLSVTNCHFCYITTAALDPLSMSAVGHPTPASSPTIHVVDCSFDHNYGFNVSGSGCGMLVMANGLVERCLFENNRTYDSGMYLVRMYGKDGTCRPRVEFRNLRLIGNEFHHETGGSSGFFRMEAGKQVFAGMKNGYPIVRDSYFASNKVYSARSRGYQLGMLYYCTECSLAFVNCSVEDNMIEYGGSEEKDAEDLSKVYFSLFNGKGIFINCAVKGSKLINSSMRELNMNDFNGNQTFVNTVVQNENDDGKYVFGPTRFLCYNTLATGFTDMTGMSFTKCRQNVQGTPTFGVRTTPDKRPGRAVWDIGWDFAVYDPDYEPKRPWRTFNDYRLAAGCAAQAPSVLTEGTADAEHLIPDANGKARYRMKNGVPKIGEAYGPLCASVDGISIFVK